MWWRIISQKLTLFAFWASALYYIIWNKYAYVQIHVLVYKRINSQAYCLPPSVTAFTRRCGYLHTAIIMQFEAPQILSLTFHFS